jgi:hypothetical protein
MVPVNGMYQFMQDNIIDQGWWQPHQMKVQVDIVFSRATPPARFGIPDLYLVHGQVELPAQCLYPAREVMLGFYTQGLCIPFPGCFLYFLVLV